MITRRQFIGSMGGGLFLTAWPGLQAEADLSSLGNIVVIMLEGGLDAKVEERGENFTGGADVAQRERLTGPTWTFGLVSPILHTILVNKIGCYLTFDMKRKSQP